MIKIVKLILFFTFLSYFANSQALKHQTIKSFALRFDDANPFKVSTTADSSVYVTYILELNDTINVSKIHVKISSGRNSNGNLMSKSYPLNSASIKNSEGNYTYRREKLKVYITTINSTQSADVKFEVATEDYKGKTTDYLKWKN